MLLSFLSVTFPHCPAPKINWDFCLPRTLCSRFSPDNTVHIVLQVLHRQRSDDCSSRLGNASIWSGDRAGRLVDHAKVGPLLSLHFAFLICVHLFALWSWWWKVLHKKIGSMEFSPPDWLRKTYISPLQLCSSLLSVLHPLTIFPVVGIERTKWRWHGGTDRLSLSLVLTLLQQDCYMGCNILSCNVIIGVARKI